MTAAEISATILQLHAGIGQTRVALKCECENLETVFLRLDDAGALWATDARNTFGYLSRGTDPTYVSVGDLALADIERLCLGFGVSLVTDPDHWPEIARLVPPDEPVSLAVEQVASAIDRVFEFARHR